MRFGHYLRHNKTSETPQRVVSVALNTYVAERTRKETTYAFDYGVAELAIRGHGQTHWSVRDASFYDAAGFWRLMESWCRDKTRTYCIVHNSMQFLTLMETFTETYKRGWQCTQAVIKCPPMIVRWQTGHGSFVLLDSANIWPVPSTSMSSGETVLPLCANKDACARCSRVETMKQSAQSTLSLAVEWMNFLSTNNLGGFATTIASQSMRVFRHRYLNHPILIDTNEDALKLAREAYVGARCECFFVGEQTGEFYLLDVNSMYASVMKDMYVPTRLRGYQTQCSMSDLVFWTERDTLVCDCDLETREPAYPIKHGLELRFQVGRFRACISGKEVLYALERGHIKRVHRIAVYDGELAFRDFVIAMWDLRKCELTAGNTRDADKYKLLLASFYGKWGQHGGEWEKYDDAKDDRILEWQEIDYDTREITNYRQFGGIIQVQSKDKESRDSHPAIAACVTSAARIRLWELICIAGKENVFYVDTDSLLVNRAGLVRLAAEIRPEDLGGLRLVGSYSHIRIHAAKDYAFDHRSRCKGVREVATKISDSRFEQMERSSLFRLARSGQTFGSVERKIVKNLKRDYTKGVILKNGRVEPHEV